MTRPRPFPGPLPPRDGVQPLWRGAYVGCGPLSAASLLVWHAERAGWALPDRDELAAELCSAQRSVQIPPRLTGGDALRATWPWAWLLGTGAYLRAAGLPLRAHGLWGYRRGRGIEERLEKLWAHGVPAVGLEFSRQQQHFGVLKSYTPGPRLHATLHADDSELVLAPRLGLGGVFWLAEEDQLT